MRIIITESQLQLIIESYPVSWNIEEYKKLNSFTSRVKYYRRHLKRISSGSSRIVYMVDGSRVFKLAKNQKGIAQNNVEIGFSQDYLWDGLVAKIFSYDKSGLWVEMEFARKLTKRDFQRIVGVTFDDYCRALLYQSSDIRPKSGFKWSKPDNMDDMWENEFVYQMLDLISGYNIVVGDLCKLDTYGLVSRDGEDNVVMIDYGLTGEVYDSYYK
jgi:hypothetical protein